MNTEQDDEEDDHTGGAALNSSLTYDDHMMIMVIIWWTLNRMKWFSIIKIVTDMVITIFEIIWNSNLFRITFLGLTLPWSQFSLWQISDHLEQNIWWDNLLSILSKITGGPFQRYIVETISDPEQNYFNWPL